MKSQQWSMASRRGRDKFLTLTHGHLAWKGLLLEAFAVPFLTLSGWVVRAEDLGAQPRPGRSLLVPILAEGKHLSPPASLESHSAVGRAGWERGAQALTH